MLRLVSILVVFTGFLQAQTLSLQTLVMPSTIVYREQKPVTFALYGLVEFKTLQEVFTYVDAQTGRWQFPDEQARQRYGDDLMRRAVESRVVSMTDEEPLEVVLTHTAQELDAAIDQLPTRLYEGQHWHLNRAEYAEAFQRVRARWIEADSFAVSRQFD